MIQIHGSMPLTNARIRIRDPDPAIFDIDLQDTKKKRPVIV
jgi:hypothetical protein